MQSTVRLGCQADSLTPCGNGIRGLERRCGFSKKVFGFGAATDKLTTMQIEPLETAEGHDLPTVRQQSVFIENRVGQLLQLARLFEQTDIRILAVSVVYSVDCAICRMILDDPEKGYEVLSGARFQVSETELLVVSLPPGKRALLQMLAALLGGEVNIFYTYPLLSRPRGAPAVAVATDGIEQAVHVLRERGFDVLSQQDLLDDR